MILSVYDIIGIQEYIFSSKRLKENIGASIIVEKVFSEFLLEAIKIVKQKITMDAEIIYIGGGNAFVSYSDKTAGVEVTKKLSKTVMVETDGMLRFVVAYLEETTTTFYNDMQTLLEILNEKKQQTIASYPSLGIGISREGVTDRLPAYDYEQSQERNYISFSAFKKREYNNKNKNYNFLKKTIPGEFVKEFEDLGQEEGENYIAVIHIDGNDMGQQLEAKIKNIPDYNNAIAEIKAFSKSISNSYQYAMTETIEHLKKNLPALKEKLNIKVDIMPIRVIVLNGDDVTFVCEGRLGIVLAEYFLKKLEGKGFSACAGVSIVKTKFPFYRAYQFAEDLCNNAKQKGKASNGVINYGSWLDFNLLKSGTTNSINVIREQEYNLPGYGIAREIINHGISFQPYNLLQRPYSVPDGLKEILNVSNEFKEKWPNSKLKELRDAFIKTKIDIEFIQEEFKSRNKVIPEYNGINALFQNNVTPYFDALELTEIYTELS